MIGASNSNTLILCALLLTLGTAQVPGQQQQAGNPLTENENPLFIGKRNINKSQINFYSSEKEIALASTAITAYLERERADLAFSGT